MDQHHVLCVLLQKHCLEVERVYHGYARLLDFGKVH
jgi:hypothetical protein